MFSGTNKNWDITLTNGQFAVVPIFLNFLKFAYETTISEKINNRSITLIFATESKWLLSQMFGFPNRQSETLIYRILVLLSSKPFSKPFWHYLFSMYTKISKKLTFLTTRYAHVYVQIKGFEMLVFRKILHTYYIHGYFLYGFLTLNIFFIFCKQSRASNENW